MLNPKEKLCKLERHKRSAQKEQSENLNVNSGLADSEPDESDYSDNDNEVNPS